jgi:PAS domain-containing protein
MQVEKLGQSELGEIVEAIPFPVFLVDQDLQILACNQSAQLLIGDDPEYILRKKGGDALGCLHSRETGDGCGASTSCPDCVIRSSVGMAFSDSRVSRAHTRVNRQAKDGSIDERFLLVTASPLKLGERQLAILLLEDITELIRLKSLLPICSGCKKIRDDDNYWNELEQYFHAHLDMEFSHGLCPDCVVKLYPEYAKRMSGT